MKCIICFESAIGRRQEAQLVKTPNGCVFHFCCIQGMIAAGSSLCPVCDEDLRTVQTVWVVTPSPVGNGVESRHQEGRDVVGRRQEEEGRDVGPTTGTSASPRDNLRQEDRAGSTPSIKMIRNSSTASGSLNKGYSRLLVESQTRPERPPRRQRQEPRVSFLLKPDYTFKIVILGDMNVGKSSLIQRYADEKFDPVISATQGCDLRVKSIEMTGKVVRLNIWDTAGQERFRSMANLYLRNAKGIIFCFDSTDLASFHSLDNWYRFAQPIITPDTAIIIVGNKSDLWSHRVVRSAQIRDLAEAWNAQYIYASAKDATNVDAIFRSLTALLLEKQLPTIVEYSPSPYGYNLSRTVSSPEDRVKIFGSPKSRKDKKCCDA